MTIKLIKYNIIRELIVQNKFVICNWTLFEIYYINWININCKEDWRTICQIIIACDVWTKKTKLRKYFDYSRDIYDNVLYFGILEGI